MIERIADGRNDYRAEMVVSSMDRQTVAVTGGNGFIGREIISHLTEQGYLTVNLARGKRREEVADEYVRTDLEDAGDVYGAIAKTRPDAIVHMGTIPDPLESPGFVTYRNNVVSSYHVLEAARELDVETVSLASSIQVVGSVYQDEPMEVIELPMDEEHPLTPRDPYGLGKHAIEITADGFGRLRGSPRTISTLRYPFVGTEEDLCRRYVDRDRSLDALEAAAPIVPGSSNRLEDVRDSLFSYIHVEDASSLALAAVRADYDGHERFWGVADDTTTDVPNAVIMDRCYPKAERTSDLGEHDGLISNEKARALLDWEPVHSWRDLR
jgi:nucleoside-diphosphate-sugar epimerase